MNKLENARNKINIIDKEIAKLFEERMFLKQKKILKLVIQKLLVV